MKIITIDRTQRSIRIQTYDHGYENASVALVMNLIRGLQHHAHITGRSVHNQHIERLWRDVHKEVMYRELYRLEDEGVLNPDTPLHKSILQTVYVLVLQSRLDRFRDAWNSHRLRSESNRSPTQIWRDGMLASQGSGHTATDPDLERRHASEPGLRTHSHRPRSGETAC